jgi:hypothetical protein
MAMTAGLSNTASFPLIFKENGLNIFVAKLQRKNGAGVENL